MSTDTLVLTPIYDRTLVLASEEDTSSISLQAGDDLALEAGGLILRGERPVWGNVTGDITDQTDLVAYITEYVDDNTASAWDDITGKPDTFPPEDHSHAISDVTGLGSALTGLSADISAASDALTAHINDATDAHPASAIAEDSTHRFATDAEKAAWDAKQDPGTTLADYGINDAAPLAHVGSGGSAHNDVAASGAAGFMTGVDKAKLDGIESGATADQTAAEILAALLTVDGSGSGLDADLLDGNSSAYFATAAGLSQELTDRAAGDASTLSAAATAAGVADAAILAAVASGYQPLDSDLSAIAALATTSYGRAFLALADAAAARAALSLGTAATSATGDFDAAGAAAAAQAASQPLDSDLTAIAALTTTSFGRALLALADAAALRTAAGLGTLATQSGTFSGTSSGTNTGDETGATVASKLHAASAKTVLVDADETSGTDSANSFSLIRTVWSDVWTYIKGKLQASVNLFTAAQRGAFSLLTDAGTVALDLSLANQYFLPIAGNRTLGVPTNIVAGQQGVIIVRQDATGSRTLAYAWPYEWAGGSAGVLSTPGCSRDMLAYSVDVYNSATVTITIAAPGVVTMAAHGFYTGQRVQITTTGALPTGLAASTTYFVSVVDANSFKLCTSLVNAAAGTFITTTGSQSGTHTLTGCSITLALSKAIA